VWHLTGVAGFWERQDGIAEVTVAERWWWNLREGRAVRDDERGRPEDMLGPYPSAEAAASWKEISEARNEAWEAADREWEEGPTDDPDA
jgi:hypothetical protein